MQGPGSFTFIAPQIVSNNTEFVVGDSVAFLQFTPSWEISSATIEVGSSYTIEEFGQFGWGTTPEALVIETGLSGSTYNDITVNSSSFSANATGAIRFRSTLTVISLGSSGRCAIYSEFAISTGSNTGVLLNAMNEGDTYPINTEIDNTFGALAAWAAAASQSFLGIAGTFTSAQLITV